MANIFKILVEYINGGLNDGGPAIQIADNELKTAQNIRVLENGGWFTRPGYIDAGLSTGENARFDGLYALDDNSLVFGIINGKIYHNGTGSMNSLIYSSMTAGKSTEMKEYNGDVYLTNTTDGFKRIAISTLQNNLTAGVTGFLTVAAGQGWRFPTSGTVNINGDDITYSSRTNDILTIDASTVAVNHIIGEPVVEVTSVSGVNGSDLDFYAEKCFVTGVPGASGNTYTDSVAFYSETATAANPEKVYDFPTGNRELIGKGGGITAIISTRDNMFIFKKRSIEYVYSIDVTSGAPLHKEISSIYGVPGPGCVCQMGNLVVFFTGKEIKTIGLQSETVNTFTIDPYFDKKIQRTLQNLDEDQSDAVLIFDNKRKYLKLWANYNGNRICFIYFVPTKANNSKRFSGAWSIDIGKSADRAIIWKDDLYWSSTDIIFQDEFGQDDNGAPISVVVESKEYTANNFFEDDEWRKLALIGAMGENSQFDLYIYVGNTIVAEHTVTASELITPIGGFPIGTSVIGYNVVGGGRTGSATVYPFDFPFEKLMLGIGSKCWYRIESNATTTAYQIDQVSFIGENFTDESLADDY
jgi:hypothetical protein